MLLSAKLGLEKTNLIAQNSSLEKRIKDISEKEDMCSNPNHGKVIATEIANPNVWDLRPKEVETPIITDNETTSVNNGDEENNNEPIINDSDSQKEEIPNEDPITPETEENPTDESNVDDTTSSPEEESQVPNVPVVDTPQDGGGGVKQPTSDNPDNIGVINTPDEQSNAEAQGKAIVTISFNFNSK